MTTEPTGQDILNVPMSENDAGAATIREYLIKLLAELWEWQEGFSGKRPFGNSGWDYEPLGALLDAGLIDGARDEDGYIDRLDDVKGNALIAKAIGSLGSES